MKHRAFLLSLFEAAVAAADPVRGIAAHLPKVPAGRTVVIGAGKASVAMAAALEELWPGPLSGLVVTRYGAGRPLGSIEVIEAAHPVPDAAGLAAAERLLELVSGWSADDLVIALMSGGGSALLPAPPAGLRLDDEIAVNRALLASGAPIGAMNTVRKHLSRIKGGRLAAATAARVHTLVVSDVPGDQAFQVASGPTLPDASTRADALAIVDLYRLALPEAVMAHLRSSAADAPRPDDPRLLRNTSAVIASAGISLAAAAEVARVAGIAAHILADDVEGEASVVGRVHAALARRIAMRDEPFAKPVVLLSGGETTVTVRGKGRGGRNAEFLLAFADAIAGVDGVEALAADTDGIDGSEDNAGAFADGSTVMRLRALGRDPRQLLANNDSYAAFAALDDLLVTGSTGTNVNDFRAIRIG